MVKSAKKILNTFTEVTFKGKEVDVFTYYSKEEEVQKFYISDELTNKQEIQVIEGDLIYEAHKVKDNVQFFLTNLGELVVLGENADKYEINNNGELTRHD